MKICFLTHAKTSLAQAENATCLIDGARGIGHEALLGSIDRLACHGDRISTHTLSFDGPGAASQEIDLAGFDMIWILSLGQRETFLDRIQLLSLLAEKTPIVNAPEALLFYHSKTSLVGFDIMPHPETHISSDALKLWTIYRSSGKPWVLKPVAGSFGNSVSLLAPNDPFARGQIDTMTAGGTRYCLLQAYVPEIAQGEKRVMIAGGKVVGCYLRRSGDDFRTNLHQGGRPELCDLTPQQKKTCERVGKHLLKRGLYFAGLDVAWPWLIEWNVISPGGIATIERLGGGNIAQSVVKSVINAVLPPSQTG